MEFVVWADVCRRLGSNFPVEIAPALPGDNIYQPDCDILLTEGTPPTESQTWALSDSVNPNVFTGQIEPLVGSNDYYLGVGWRLPDEVGNVVQTDAYRADISFYTEQYRNNPDFVCARQDITTTIGDGWGPAVDKEWLASARWGNNLAEAGDFELALKTSASTVLDQDGHVWTDGGTETFTLVYDGTEATFTIGGSEVSSTPLSANGDIIFYAKTADQDGEEGWVRLENMLLNGSPLPDLVAHGSAGTRDLKHMTVEGMDLTSGFTLTGDVTFEWDTGHTQDEGPAFEVVIGYY
jgi:hypothetical protein